MLDFMSVTINLFLKKNENTLNAVFIDFSYVQG